MKLLFQMGFTPKRLQLIYPWIAGLISGLLGAAIVVLSLQKPTQIATIDLRRVVDTYMAVLSESSLSADEREQAIRRFGEDLDAALAQLSQEHHRILLPIEAVIAGANDETNTLFAALQLRDRDDRSVDEPNASAQ